MPEVDGKELTASNSMDLEVMQDGAFKETLMRNNKKIRQDRAIVIVESAYIQFKRAVEDLEIKIREVKRDRENMLDLSPHHAQDLMVASDFKADEFVAKDIELGITIRNLEIKHEVAKTRFIHLFGEV